MEVDLCSYKAVRKVQEINCHKKKEQLIFVYCSTPSVTVYGEVGEDPGTSFLDISDISLHIYTKD